MKIAVFHNLPSGGALRMLRQKTALFRAMGHEVRVYTFSTSDEMFAPMPADRAVVEPLDFRGGGRWRRYLEASGRLAMKIEADSPDRIWVEKCRFTGSPSVLRFLRGPAIFYMQEPLRTRRNEALAPGGSPPPAAAAGLFSLLKKLPVIRDHFLRAREDRESARLASAVYTNSEFSARWIKNVYGIDARVLYQGIDTGFFSPASLSKKPLVVSVGRLDRAKGHDFAIEALSRVPAGRRPALSIVADDGTPDESERLLELARRRGVETSIYKRISDEDLRAQYRQSLAVLCASYREPFGLVPLEAMACAAPVLAVNEGGFAETVKDGEVGWLLPRDPQLWAEKILFLAERPGEALDIGERGRRIAENTWGLHPFSNRLRDSLL